MARASTYIGKQHETGSEARTDPQHRKTSRPEIHTTCPTSSHARRSKSVTYLRTTHDRTRRTHLRRQNDECVCMTGSRSSKKSTERSERRRLPSRPPTSTSRTTLTGTLDRSCGRLLKVRTTTPYWMRRVPLISELPRGLTLEH